MLQTSSKRSPKYICSNCVTVQKDLVDLLKTQDVPFYVVSRDKEEIKRLRKELSACENLLKVQGDSCRNIEKMMKEQLESKEELKKIMMKERKDLEECVRTKTEEIKNIVKEVTSTDKTYANALTKQPSFRTIMKEAQDEKVQAIMQVAKINDLTEQRERELRATNIIIHGVEEVSTEEQSDETWIKLLKKDLEIDFETKFIGRLGSLKPQSHRPLKIVLKNIDEKKCIFANLKKLKGKSDYTGISVAEDYTMAERSVIKTWVEKAKEKNEKEGYGSDNIWRVRGSPKKGTMHLKKFTNTKNSIN